MNNDIPLIRPVYGIVSMASVILQGLAKRLRSALRLFGRKTWLAELSGQKQRNISFVYLKNVNPEETKKGGKNLRQSLIKIYGKFP